MLVMIDVTMNPIKESKSQVDKKVVMQDNLKVDLLVTEQQKRCTLGECDEDFSRLGSAQTPFHVPPVLSNLSENCTKKRSHYSVSTVMLKFRTIILEFNKQHLESPKLMSNTFK